MYDHTGKKYLDLFAGIVTVSVGHCHPRVNKVLKEQIDQLWHTTQIYWYPQIHEYAKKLADKFPDGLDQVYFVNSGSEANDLAMMLARLHTGKFNIVALQNAYHGASPYARQVYFCFSDCSLYSFSLLPMDHGSTTFMALEEFTTFHTRAPTLATTVTTVMLT